MNLILVLFAYLMVLLERVQLDHASQVHLFSTKVILTKREILKLQCDEHKSEFVFYMDKIGVKMAELGRLHFYSNELKSYGTVRVELMDHMPIKFIDSEEESEKDLGTRESYHCNKADCVHRSSFDLYLKKQTAIWEYKSHCKLVRSKQIILIASSFLFCF